MRGEVRVGYRQRERSSRDFVFFFQAEDGIRDYKVTGVQTCALPICRAVVGAELLARERAARLVEARFVEVAERDPRPGHLFPRGAAAVGERAPEYRQIGRASCRGRV